MSERVGVTGQRRQRSAAEREAGRVGRGRMLALSSLAAVVLSAGLATPGEAFSGHHCSRSSCRYFTSSYSTAIYFYDRRTCDQWKDLSNKYLNGFRSKKALKRHFDRKLHAPC